MTKSFLFLTLIAASLCIGHEVSAQTALLDSNFHYNGLQDSIQTISGTTNAIALQSDGKIIAALATGNKLSMYRLNSNGTKDNSFGTGGIYQYDNNTSGAQIAHDVVVQPDGRILMLGEVFVSGQNKNVFLMRLDAAGAFDAAFGSGGITTTNTPGGNTQDVPTKILLRPNGKIVVAGLVNTLSNDDQQLLIQYNANGTPDTTFGTGGIVKATIAGSRTDGLGFAMQPDGKIIVVGASVSGTNTVKAAIGRYNTDGTLDATFDTDGWQTYSMAGALTTAGITVGVQSTGKIVVGIRTNNNNTIYAIRLNNDGSMDATFGTAGLFSYTRSQTDWSFQHAILVLPGDDILIGGDLASGATAGFYDYGLLRLTADGSLRTNWANGGIITTDFRKDYDNAYALALQPDGKILAAGSSRNGDNTTLSYPSIARYKANLTITPNAIQPYAKSSGLIAYPNPAQGTIYLHSLTNTAGELIITNHTGQLVRTVQLNAANSYSAVIAGLQPGIYFAQDPNRNERIKLLVAE